MDKPDFVASMETHAENCRNLLIDLSVEIANMRDTAIARQPKCHYSIASEYRRQTENAASLLQWVEDQAKTEIEEYWEDAAREVDQIKRGDPNY